MSNKKVLKIWNGRGHGKYNNSSVYVAAYSQEEAARLVSKACEAFVTVHEIKKYYSPDCWGRQMDGITASEPCVYVAERYDGKPKRII